MKTFKHNSSESSLLLGGGVALSEYSFLSCQGYGSDAAIVNYDNGNKDVSIDFFDNYGKFLFLS